jgi:hypothetical protein
VIESKAEQIVICSSKIPLERVLLINKRSREIGVACRLMNFSFTKPIFYAPVPGDGHSSELRAATPLLPKSEVPETESAEF